MSRPDRSWIRRWRTRRGAITEEYKDGVDEFLNVAYANVDRDAANQDILCPCRKCKNCRWKDRYNVGKDLYLKGFLLSYTNWILHGEKKWGEEETFQEYPNPSDEASNPYMDMVRDAMLNDVEEDPNPSASKFYDLLKEADEPLWDGCVKQSTLSAVAQLMNLKSEFNMSESCFDRMISIIKSMLPESERLPTSFYKCKRLMRDLGLEYQKFDACRNHCMLYYKENSSLTSCAICGEPRYKARKESDTSKKNVPNAVFRYFPVVPRLQRLFLSEKTAAFMRWHKEGAREDPTSITHPSDAEAWKRFDALYPAFSSEARNVRLGLCTDGFNPFGASGTAYSCWPVFVTPYNLPPSMCMRRENILLTCMIPGPRSPSKSLDVYLRPLIDELNMLWEEGVITYDRSKKQNFVMKAALMWTISDFPAYGMLSGWSTKGKLACPICGRDTKSFYLKNSRKVCWFDCHRMFLPLENSMRRDRKCFKKNISEYASPPRRLTGEEVLEQVSKLGEVTFGLKAGTCKQIGFGTEHNWERKSIFWELPYWASNLVRHNLDVMHVEKNVFDNIFNTVMDVKGRTKDSIQAREDMKIICRRPELDIVHLPNGKLKKPKATYVLDNEQRKMVFEWVKQLKFPDGYASNISRCFNSENGKIHGMKSHDCHIFMQRLLPIAFKEMMPKAIWETLVELSMFFKELCASSIREEDMLRLESSIVLSVCKAEKIFPPSFFDVMEHLIVHLPYETRVAGPVQYRWMYPFERCMLFLKRKAKNKAKIEGSICEAYFIEEVSNFTSLYFEPHIQTRHTQVPRNDDGGEEDESRDALSIFTYPYRLLGRGRRVILSDRELATVENYVLANCSELEPYLE